MVVRPLPLVIVTMQACCILSSEFIEEQLAAGVGEEVRESEELQRAFFVLLHALTTNELTTVILEAEGTALETLISALIANASSLPEPASRKGCFQVGICATCQKQQDPCPKLSARGFSLDARSW